MAMPFIDPLPSAPTPADPEAVFDDKAYEMVAALTPFVEQTNTLALAVEAEATRSESEADRSQAQVNAATTEANRAQAEAERAKDEADRAEQARDDAVVVVTDGQGSLTPAPGKFPVAGTSGTIKQDWIENLQFELDALRVAKNKALYGDGPYPVLDLQFQGAKMLDPRITFTRSTPDWDWEGKRYEVDEPIMTDRGLWVSGTRTNLWPYAMSLSTTNPLTIIRGEVIDVFGTEGRFTKGVMLTRNSENSYFYTVIQDLDSNLRHTFTAYISVEGGGEPKIGQVSNEENLDAAFIGFGTNSTNNLNLIHKVEHYFGEIWKYTATFNLPGAISRSIGFMKSNLRTERGLKIWAIQVELGEVGTPLIPTNGSQVTVAPTNVSVPNSGFNEGAVVVGFFPINYGTIFSIGGSLSNSLRPSVQPSPQRISAVAQNLNLPVPFTENPLGKNWRLGVSVDSGVVSATANGNEVASRSFSGIAWEGSSLVIGKFSFQNASYITGYLKHLSKYDIPLTDEQLQELTS